MYYYYYYYYIGGTERWEYVHTAEVLPTFLVVDLNIKGKTERC